MGIVERLAPLPFFLHGGKQSWTVGASAWRKRALSARPSLGSSCDDASSSYASTGNSDSVPRFLGLNFTSHSHRNLHRLHQYLQHRQTPSKNGRPLWENDSASSGPPLFVPTLAKLRRVSLSTHLPLSARSPLSSSASYISSLPSTLHVLVYRSPCAVLDSTLSPLSISPSRSFHSSSCSSGKKRRMATIYHDKAPVAEVSLDRGLPFLDLIGNGNPIPNLGHPSKSTPLPVHPHPLHQIIGPPYRGHL